MEDEMGLSRRERQIMAAVYAAGECSAEQVRSALLDPPTLTAVRTLIRILERKGHLKHRKAARHFVYRPARPPKQAAHAAFRQVLATFFSGSVERAFAAHLADPKSKIDADELTRLRDLIDAASRKGS
jgi:BlaI family penicillinase repressor